jgi:hypothetical protein
LNASSLSTYLSINSIINSGSSPFPLNPITSILNGFGFSDTYFILSPSVNREYFLSNFLNLIKSFVTTAALVLIGAFNLNSLNISPGDGRLAIYELICLTPVGLARSFHGNSFSDDASANVKAKSQSLKRWVKDQCAPVIAVHQATRSKGAPGEPITMLSMAYGGEQEATMVIGVRRKRDDQKLDSWERQCEQDTITLHLAKNKRPPARVTAPDGLDMYMDPNTGLIRPLREGDRQGQTSITTSEVGNSAADALRIAQERMNIA